MIDAIQIDDNTIYEYDLDCLKCREEKLMKEHLQEANFLALLLCLYSIRKDV